jgi:hypothetical protein
MSLDPNEQLLKQKLIAKTVEISKSLLSYNGDSDVDEFSMQLN